MPLGFTELVVAVLRMLFRPGQDFHAIAQQLAQAQRGAIAGRPAGSGADLVDAAGPPPPQTPQAGIGESPHHGRHHGSQ